MARCAASSAIPLDSLTVRSIGVESDTDVRSVLRELRKPGCVRGRAGERIRAELAKRGLRPVRAACVAELEFPSKSEQPAREGVAGGLLSGRVTVR
jgi:hypothetical protein